jgi:RloB-like protein
MHERWLVAVNGKTEKIYVTALSRQFRSGAVQIEHFAKDPLKQISEAEKFGKREATKFARVYVVFDRDSFDIKPALAKIEELNRTAATRAKRRGCEWIPIVSTPCFELWYLLHFRYTNASFTGQTPCRDLQSRFPIEFENYWKVDPKAAKVLVETRLEEACSNAKMLDEDASVSKTAMWQLVEAFRDKNSAGE